MSQVILLIVWGCQWASPCPGSMIMPFSIKSFLQTSPYNTLIPKTPSMNPMVSLNSVCTRLIEHILESHVLGLNQFAREEWSDFSDESLNLPQS